VLLRRELEGLDATVRSRRPKRLPVVLSREEARATLRELRGLQPTYGLMGLLLYGSGLRLMECLRLRFGGPRQDRWAVLSAFSAQRDLVPAEVEVTHLAATISPGETKPISPRR